MTPREKAIQLVEQFASVLMHDEVYEDSIKCALIAVNEILNINSVDKDFSLSHYWLDVKDEIVNL